MDLFDKKNARPNLPVIRYKSCHIFLQFFVLFALFFGYAEVAFAEESASQHLLPDTGGTMKSVVVSVNSARRAALRNAGLITSIVNNLPSSIEFNILTNDLEAFTVARNPWPGRIHFISLPADNPITIWTQDPFLVLKNTEGRTSLLASKDFQRAGDQVMAKEIADRLGYDLQGSLFYFEGGNIVSDDEYAFVGANTIRFNAIEMSLSETEVVKGLEKEIGRRILVIGPYPQAVAHIDMMLTPLGNKEVVVADAGLGAEIAEKSLKDDAGSVVAFEELCKQYFFGNPAIQELTGVDGRKITPPAIQGKTAEMIALSKKVALALNGIAASLEGFGYRVHRVPFLFGGPESLGERAEREKLPTQAAYPMLTYNNVLIENKLEKKVVYLPQYGWHAMDSRAVKAWLDMGYSVQPVQGLTISSMYGGSLRCSVKVLERGEHPKKK